METKYRLMTPGPVSVPEEVLKELAKPMLHHRTPEFEEILTRVLTRLPQVFQTTQPVFIHPSTGSGAMESALVNTLHAGDEVLCVVSGKFGERWREMCEVFGYQVTSLNVKWGEAVDIKEFETIFNSNKNFKAVLTQACETSTAVCHPIQQMASIVSKNQDCLFMVDAITAVGVMDLQMDGWGLDLVVGGSQKSFMLPAGLSFLAVSKKAWKRIEVCKTPRYYWDLRKEKKANLKGQSFFSTPVSHIRALDKALDILLEKPISQNIQYYKNLSEAFRRGAKALGFELFSKAPSPSVTALLVPTSIDSEKLRDHLESKYKLTLMGGQEKLKGKILRVGHLANISVQDLKDTLQLLHLGLQDFGVSSDLNHALKQYEDTLKNG